MSESQAKERLVRFLDERAFQPVLRAKADAFPQAKRGEFEEVRRATESERERFHNYGSAREVVEMFEDDLHSEPAKDIHRKLKDLGLPTIDDVRGEFESLARDLGVKGH